MCGHSRVTWIFVWDLRGFTIGNLGFTPGTWGIHLIYLIMTHTMWGSQTIAKLVNTTLITMAYDTQITMILTTIVTVTGIINQLGRAGMA